MIRTVIAFALFSTAVVSSGCLARSLSASSNALQSGYVRRPMPPVDEGELDPDLKAFRQAFVEAVAARNATAVLDATAPELRPHLSGLALPREAFVGGRLDADWGRLEKLLALGGSFTTTRGAQVGRREFCAPYTYQCVSATTGPPRSCG
jgi:hypothetical protein